MTVNVNKPVKVADNSTGTEEPNADSKKRAGTDNRRLQKAGRRHIGEHEGT